MLLIQILLIPLAHFIGAVLFPGAALRVVLERNPSPIRSAAGGLLYTVSLGLLANTLAFLVMLALRPLLGEYHPGMAVGKYAFDLLLIAFALRIAVRRRIHPLREILSLFARRSDALLLVLCLAVGVVAVLNHPYVLDSGQLIITNYMIHTPVDFWEGHRYGFGFSALLFFPGILCRGIPLATLAAGFKPILFFLLGCTVIHGVGALGFTRVGASKWLYTTVMIFSYFGLEGMFVLGKDSQWGLLFLLLALFHFLDETPDRPRAPLVAALLCALALGMIVLPYLVIFLGVYLAVRLMPRGLSAHPAAYICTTAVLLVVSSLLMPVRLPISNHPTFSLLLGPHSYWPPTDGQTSFFAYLWPSGKDGGNPPFIALAGLLGILALPLARRRFASPRWRATALFLPTAAALCLGLTLLTRHWMPVTREQKIPFTILSSFDLWNLIKDIPRWLLPALAGLFLIVLLESATAAVRENRGRLLHTAATALLLVGLLPMNLPVLRAWGQTAEFHRYGGHKSKQFAAIAENFHRNPQINCYAITEGVTGISQAEFSMAMSHYIPGFVIYPISLTATPLQDHVFKRMPFFLISRREDMNTLFGERRARSPLVYYEMEYFPETDEGLYVFSPHPIPLRCTCRASSRQ